MSMTDQAFLAMAICSLIVTGGLLVTTPASTSEALAQLNRGWYDDIVSDYQMQGL